MKVHRETDFRSDSSRTEYDWKNEIVINQQELRMVKMTNKSLTTTSETVTHLSECLCEYGCITIR